MPIYNLFKRENGNLVLQVMHEGYQGVVELDEQMKSALFPLMDDLLKRIRERKEFEAKTH